ncbi:Myotubularin-related protein 13 [Hypsibius exemplaris]|uniref:Myotubularin-related protein 13 n=1 Tax=Hypsibius exemplaris TaxID=2072580 RepID=A0A1W0WTK0_HYPEX|nr:Myotubularin-related protein 13 [Hypsibius exemplaris]
MSRLVDYFAVVGYDHDKEQAGKVLQRFPENEWPDTPFHQGIEMFCQPQGWKTYQSPKVPEFFVSVLTDIDALRHYCACLTFTETFLPTASSNEEDEDVSAVAPPVRYAPKSICLISRHEHFDTFRQCLGIIYAIYVDRLQYKLEVIIGNLLGYIQVPPAGGPQTSFSIGADDRQAVQPAGSASLPISRDSVVNFCKEIGLSNVILLLCATLADSKILFYSSSYLRLVNASHALTTICYPLKYSHVYVPVLPAPLLEVLNSPTPYIMGIHVSLKEQVLDLLDVIFVDLDGCRVEVPESVTISPAPDAIYARTMTSLKMVLDPSLLISDHAFPQTAEESSPRRGSLQILPNNATGSPHMTDKELRAVFIQFFCELFAGYRSCLTVVRIHPDPVITFEKAKFLGQRNYVGDEFVTKVVGSMAFGKFIQEYAPPFRVQNVFDEIYSDYAGIPSDCSPQEYGGFPLARLREIANRLYANENPQSQPYVQKCLRPSDVALARRVADYTFPWMDAKNVEDIIQTGLQKQSQLNKWPGIRSPQNVVIPLGYSVSNASAPMVAVNSARRLEVLSNCISHIFEGRFNDANKLLPAVTRVLAIPSARLALAAELSLRVQSNRAMLEHQQFELVVKLINCALQDDSVLDEYGVAAAFMPLVTAFCRKLCTGVIQFAYTRVQEHEIWSSLAFWESAFYKDVQQNITALYWPSLLTSGSPIRRPTLIKQNGISSERRPSEDDLKAFSASLTSPTALDIAADQLRSEQSGLSPAEQREMVDREESTVFSQAIHYANRIVYLRVPLDVSSSRVRRRNSIGTDTNSNSNLTNSYPESDTGSMSEESGFQEADDKSSRDISSTVIKFVTKFVDKVCGESHVTQEHIKQLHHMIPGVVAMHVEGLEAVYKESKHLQPIQKTKILKPMLLAGEELVFQDGLRAHLLVDGREEATGGASGGLSFLPCDGALFLTNYRVIFMGVPVDSYVSDYVVLRSFPVSALTKEKKLTGQYISQANMYSSECLQLRSATFQLIKVGFDEEVSADLIDQFRKFLEQMRYPMHISEILNHASLSAQNTTLAPGKNGKKSSIRGFAKKTLQRTAQAAGIKTKSVKKETKHYNPSATPLPDRRLQLNMTVDRSKPAFEEEGSDDDSDTLGPNGRDNQSFERVIERSYVKDYRRMGLIASASAPRRADEYRLCQANLHYKVCPSYPALIVVPNNISDDAVRSLARHFKETRLPAVVWKHPRTHAVLIRSGSYQNARMGSVFKNSSMTNAGSMMTIPASSHDVSVTVSSQADLEKYLSAVVHSMPNGINRRPSTSGSILTVNQFAYSQGTPESIRKHSTSTPWNRAVQTLKSSAGKSGGTVSKRSSQLFPSARGGSLLHAGTSEIFPDNLSEADRASLSQGGGRELTHLYVLAEKSSIKAMRSEALRCDFIPLEYPDIRRVKSGHKKLLQVLVPSAKEADEILQKQGGYFGQIESLDWLKQIQRLLKISGAVVDLMDAQGASVLLALEEGWDVTCQVSALSQLFMDPHYRTIAGFADLVEKEFASFGHRFGHRSNLTQASQNSGIAPVLLQFLDCVAQVHRQFPISFEFNEYFLKYLAFHSASNRFTNFLTDSEAERVDLGLFDNRKMAHSPYEPDLKQWPVSCGSIWEYIAFVHKSSPKFYNFMYTRPLLEEQVLRPFSTNHSVFLWDFYLEESLAFGSLYDLELIDPDYGPESTDPIPKNGTKRRIINACYNNASQTIQNSYAVLFEEIQQLEMEMGRGVEDWKEHWDRMDQLVPLPLTTPSSQMIRSHSRRLQTQITLEILDKGRHNDSSQPMGHPHRFIQENYTTPFHCYFCNQVLWGNAFTCADCGYRSHEKCAEQVPNTCSKVKVMTSQHTEPTVSRHILVGRDDLRDVSPSSPKRQGTYVDNGPSLSDSRAMEGFLNKRGAMLKQWKMKWFVLDSIKHQLRYYDSREDVQIGGIIDLAEVISVGPTGPGIILQSAPKNTDDRACFDVRTLKRTYNLCARNPAAAQEWMEKIQLYLQ